MFNRTQWDLSQKSDSAGVGETCVLVIELQTFVQLRRCSSPTPRLYRDCTDNRYYCVAIGLLNIHSQPGKTFEIVNPHGFPDNDLLHQRGLNAASCCNDHIGLYVIYDCLLYYQNLFMLVCSTSWSWFQNTQPATFVTTMALSEMRCVTKEEVNQAYELEIEGKSE